jgi:hypothetical protein
MCTFGERNLTLAIEGHNLGHNRDSNTPDGSRMIWIWGHHNTLLDPTLWPWWRAWILSASSNNSRNWTASSGPSECSYAPHGSDNGAERRPLNRLSGRAQLSDSARVKSNQQRPEGVGGPGGIDEWPRRREFLDAKRRRGPSLAWSKYRTDGLSTSINCFLGT